MATYLFITTDNAPAKDIIERISDYSNIQLKDDTWLISANDTTTKEISASILNDESTPTNHLIVKFDAYWGRESNDIWEWINNTND